MEEEESAQRQQRLNQSLAKAKSKRQLAWELLKKNRNPEYVALRYGYPVSLMREALAKLEQMEADSGKPEKIELRSGKVVPNPSIGGGSDFTRAGDALPKAFNRQALAVEPEESDPIDPPDSQPTPEPLQ